MRRAYRHNIAGRARILFGALLIAAGLLLGACKEAGTESYTAEQEVTEKRYYRYALNEAKDMLEEEVIRPAGTDPEDILAELVTCCTGGDQGRALLPEGVTLDSHTLTDGVLKLDLGAGYQKLAKAEELLVRAGLVKTFTQIEGISYVELSVNGKPVTDGSGEPIGRLSQENFVENSGRSIHSYQNVIMTLYYTDESGTVLMPEERSVYFNSNEPLEKAVLSELIRGTNKTGYFPTLLPETKVLSVAIQEGICYVNFDESFRNSILSVQEDVQIYSIVNSLVDTCNVSRVQFTVNGKSNMTFRESMELDKLYEKNEVLEVEPSE